MKKIFTILSVFFVSSAVAQNIANGGFESWTTVAATFPAPAYDECNNWNSLNSLTSALGVITCYKATAGADVHSGLSAIKLVTKQAGSQIANGLVTTGTINVGNSSVGGGVAYTLRPDSIIGWYKCAPMTGDSGFVEIQLLGSGGDTDTIAYAIFRSPGTAVTTFTRFAVKINYRNANPVVKSLWILSSSRSNSVHIVNSTLFLDDVQLGSDLFLSVDEPVTSTITVGPNPSSGRLIVSNIGALKANFILYDLTGSIVEQEKLNSGSTSIDLTQLPNGMYIYSIINGNGLIMKTGKVVVEK